MHRAVSADGSRVARSELTAGTITPDWDPRAEHVLRDQRAAYDDLRERCPVAYSEFMRWSVFRHADVLRILGDHETFSYVVSRHLSVPNGMAPPEHTAYRQIVERYFHPERLGRLEPACRRVAAELLRGRTSVEVVADLALPFTALVQCAFLDAPPALAQPLVRWARQNHAATLNQDRAAQATIAQEFEDLIGELCDRRADSDTAATDVISSLMREEVFGRPLTRQEIASILRNWTVGEIGTISASIGIVVEFLAAHGE
jgi:cytochrome P450